jgi:hypothetical protein
MASQTQSALHDFTLSARELVLNEVSELLEGSYGLLPTGAFEPAQEYPAVASVPGASDTRARLEKYIADEVAAGLKAKDARDKLTREAAFTWLNRLVAFRMMEASGLIRQSIERGSESRAFKLWLTEAGNEAELKLYEAGTLPQDDLGEGPRDQAYRHYLLHLCRKTAEEIRVLFDPDKLSSRLCPRPRALAELLSQLNAVDLVAAWSDDQTIGWVYQYFNECEKAEVFARLSNGEKIRPVDIPAATQIFTPRWIVRALVQNSLGRLWIEMHPDSRLRETLDYLVPVEVETRAVLRPVREITLLDPATGTMHFGLVAFDLFLEMYREEFERAGESGWLEEPSVEREEDIPVAIISNNLFGIDIDLRAVQLSALTLLLKAKSVNKDAVITDHNLACADVLLLNGPRLVEFLEDSKFTRPIYERLIRGLWEHLKDANQMGSLLKLESDLDKLIEEEKQKIKTPQLPGFTREQFETEAGRREFWEIIHEQIMQAFDHFARQRAEEGDDESYFTGEVRKGLGVLRLVMRDYDVVATNPPYLNLRNMSAAMIDHLKSNYPASKGDLYAAFIDRCSDLLAPGGRMSMITQQSFMFISSYEGLRKKLRERIAIETMIHVGPRAFAEVAGEKVNTTVFVLRREDEAKRRDDCFGTYFRLVKEPDAEAKRRAFERAIARLKADQNDPGIFRCRQGDFDAIPGSPWAYWIRAKLRQLFESNAKLGETARPRQGLSTADNFRFVRFWWEVGKERVAFGYSGIDTAKRSGKQWFPYMKGGSFRRWYGNHEHVLNYGRDGYELKAWADPLYGNSGWSRIIKSTEFYFRRGLTWNKITSGRLSIRLSPEGFIFSDAGCGAFPDAPDLFKILGILNSVVGAVFLTYISPTVNNEVGHIARLPIPTKSSEHLNGLVEQAIAIARADSEQDETTFDFIAPPAWRSGVLDLAARKANLADIEKDIDEEVYGLYGIAGEDRAAIEAELASPKAGEDGDADEGSESQDEVEENSAQLSREALAVRWIGYAVGIVLGRFAPGEENALGRGSFSSDTAARSRELSDTDGIVTLDEGHSDDLAARVLTALQLMLGEAESAALLGTVLENGGEPAALLRRYLERDFFKQHIKQYRKRPIYWLLQSPRKTFSAYLFHERMTRDTLFKLQREYVDAKINLIEARMAEARKARDSSEGRERKRHEKDLDDMTDALDDLRELSRRIKAILDRGYQPHIDDGVLLNMSPLWELVPSWQAEPKKAWQALERGDYDWSHTAMDYWPDRVREKCQTNKSYAIAHGLDMSPEA